MTMRNYAVILMCALTVSSAAQAMPVYAAAAQNTAAHANARSQERLSETAMSVQLAFQDQDMKRLSKLCNYPLTISYGDGTMAEVKNKEAFLKLDSQVIFSAKMQDAIAATNAAKLEAVGNAGAQMGGDNGLNMYQFNGKWKINSIYLDLPSNEEVKISDKKEAALTIQKTFSYRDLETLAKLCNYPLTIVLKDGSIKEANNQQELLSMGEDKVFTASLCQAIDKTDINKLQDVGEGGAQLGGDSGLAIYRFNGFWKINNIYQ